MSNQNKRFNLIRRAATTGWGDGWLGVTIHTAAIMGWDNGYRRVAGRAALEALEVGAQVVDQDGDVWVRVK